MAIQWQKRLKLKDASKNKQFFCHSLLLCTQNIDHIILLITVEKRALLVNFGEGGGHPYIHKG